MANLIVAAANLEIIGQGTRIPWHYPEDLKWFKKQTMGGVLIMGRITWESLPSKTLPGREIIVVSSQSDLECTVASDVMDAIFIAGTQFPLKQVWIAGGAKIYAEALRLNLVSKIFYTDIPEELVIDDETVRLPNGVFEGFALDIEYKNEKDHRLTHRIYACRSSLQQ